MRRVATQDRDLLLVVALAAAGTAAALLKLEPTGLRTVLALPLALILPGYAITAALMPTRDLTGFERAIFSVGTSFAATALTGLALNWTSRGLVRENWAAALCAVVVVATCVAVWRRGRLEEFEPIVAGAPSRLWSQLRAAPLLTTSCLVAVVIAAGALVAARQDAAAIERRAGVTELWILQGKQGREVRVGVAHHGEAPLTYELAVDAGTRRVRTFRRIHLTSNQRWTATVDLGEPRRAHDTFARLYVQGTPGIFRQVKLARKQGDVSGTVTP
jgi:uncharacterized membrane protein